MKVNKKLNIALIGCGRIARKHLTAIQKLRSEGAALKCVADKNFEKCLALIDNLPITPFQDFKHENFLRDIDLAVILTESGNHYEHAKWCLNNGVNVLVEKPVTLKLSHANELERLSIANNCQIYVVKQNRFNAPVRQAQNFIDRGYLGEKQIAAVRVRWCRTQEYYDLAEWRGTWLMDGGVISNQASHHIDLMSWFMGPVKCVQAIDRTFGVEIETENTILALIEFESGAVGTIEATTSTRPRNVEGSFSLQGSKGVFEIGGFAVNEMRYIESCVQDFNQREYSISQKSDMDTSDVYGSGHEAVYNEILKDYHGQANEAIKIQDALPALKLIHMIYKSVESGKKTFISDNDISSARMGL